MIYTLTTEVTLAGLGAVLLGVGSALSGWAALRKAKDEHIKAQAELRKSYEDTEQSIDDS